MGPFMVKIEPSVGKVEDFLLWKLEPFLVKNGTVIMIKDSLDIMEKPMFDILVTSSVLQNTNLKVSEGNSLISHSELWLVRNYW